MSPPAAAATGLTPLLEQLRARAHRYGPDLGGALTVRLRGSHHPAYSSIYRLALEGEGAPVRELVVKVFPGAAVQFRGMQAVWPHFEAHPTWRIPRPLDLLEDGPAVVMEAVSGVTLQQCLPAIAFFGARLVRAARCCRRAGEWLRFYHDLGCSEAAVRLDVEGKWPDLERALSRLARRGPGARVLPALAADLARLATALRDRPLVASHVHGEYTVDNVLIDGERVTALDVWGHVRNAVDHDLASFLNSLLLLRLTRPAPWSALGRLGEAFLDAYGGGRGHDPGALVFLQACGLVDVAAEIRARRPSALAQAWVKRVLVGALATLGERARAALASSAPRGAADAGVDPPLPRGCDGRGRL